MAGSILSVSKESSIGESLRARGKKDEKMEEKKLKRQKLFKSVYIILGFGIMLICISVIFLILENMENTKFQSLINLFYIFHIFKSNGSISSSTHFSVIQSCIAIDFKPNGLFASFKIFKYFSCRGVIHPSEILLCFKKSFHISSVNSFLPLYLVTKKSLILIHKL